MEDAAIKGILEDILAFAVGVTVIICLAWVVINIIRTMKQRANMRTRAEIYNRLIDKFGAAPEFIAFLESDAGLRFIEENTVQNAQPLGKILASLQLGIILTLLGIGLLITGNIFGGSLGGDLYIVLTVGGVVGLMVGVGFLISSMISYRLCKTWGILTASVNQTEKVNVRIAENQ